MLKTFSAFWLSSTVVSVLISVTTDLLLSMVRSSFDVWSGKWRRRRKKQQLLSLGDGQVVHLVWHQNVPLPWPGYRREHPFYVSWISALDGGDPILITLPLGWSKGRSLQFLRKLALGKAAVHRPGCGDVVSGDSLELID